MMHVVPTTLILGAGGMLGRAVAAACPSPVVTAGRAELEGNDAQAIIALVARVAPSLVINCAADVDADGAERDISKAMAANGVLPGFVAEACQAAGALMVQVSSTGCYGAWKDTPFTEDDPAQPTTAHHRTKLIGERAVAAAASDHLIARVGWLYGGDASNPRNFVWRRLVEASTSSQLSSDDEQHGCPSNVADVARQLFVAIDAGVRGTINIVTQGSASRYEYVRRIIEAAQMPCEVKPAPAFVRAAPVSHNETAINARLQERGLDIMPHWATAIDNYVAKLRSDGLLANLEGNAT
jgi:dTDP-4-dehydrorhamnose reductase